MQSVSTLREHKQFFALYNTQTNKQACMNQEVLFLQAIHENFDKALISNGLCVLNMNWHRFSSHHAANKEAFVTQITTKVGAFKSNRDKAEERVAKEKALNDQLRLVATFHVDYDI